jgi:hypothetical protein
VDKARHRSGTERDPLVIHGGDELVDTSVSVADNGWRLAPQSSEELPIKEQQAVAVACNLALGNDDRAVAASEQPCLH